jgi:hypothetical protein
LAADAALHIGPGSHDGDNVNVTNSDVPGTVSESDLKGVKVDGLHNLLGGDASFENSQQGGHVGGTPQPNYNGQAGAIDPGPDGNGPPQMDGPTPRDTHHPIATNPAGHAQNQGGGHTDGTHVSLSPNAVDSSIAQLTEALSKALGASQSDGHKTAQSVDADHTGHGIASVLGASAPHDGRDDFAIVLHAANNPAAFGLLDHAAANEPDSSSGPHLPIHTDLAIHLPEIHVEAAPAAPVTVDHHINPPPLEPFFQQHH